MSRVAGREEAPAPSTRVPPGGTILPVKVLVAPDSYKGSLTAPAAAAAIAAGVRRALPTALAVQMPLADGGEGTVEALVRVCGGTAWEVTVRDPLDRPVCAAAGSLGGGVVVIEMAAASGLPLLQPDERDPFRASTFGTGELIRAALDRGAREIILGVGGSATVDGGAGALQALGARLLNRAGAGIDPGNAGLAALDRIDASSLDPRLQGVRLRVACDVRNPLIGPRGAAAVFGPQKGAAAADIPVLDANLARFASVVERDLGVAVADVPGAGAAGGLTAGLLAIGAGTEPGIDLVLDAAGFVEQVRDADLVFTGEGRIDGQTAHGKVISGVLARTAPCGVPVVALAGMVRAQELDELYAAGLTAAFAISDGPASQQQHFERASALLERAAEAVMRLWSAGHR